jgi:hypothetical protein
MLSHLSKNTMTMKLLYLNIEVFLHDIVQYIEQMEKYKLKFHECKWAPHAIDIQHAPENSLMSNLLHFKAAFMAGTSINGISISEWEFYQWIPKEQVYFFNSWSSVH